MLYQGHLFGSGHKKVIGSHKKCLGEEGDSEYLAPDCREAGVFVAEAILYKITHIFR